MLAFRFPNVTFQVPKYEIHYVDKEVIKHQIEYVEKLVEAGHIHECDKGFASAANWKFIE